MAAQIPPSTRNAALDNLRVVAMFLGLVTHGVLPYTASGLVGFPVRDQTRHLAADVCYFAVHDFRMQLFFVLAGFGASALAARRGSRELVRNRLARVALPLALAVLVLCPALHLVFAHHAGARGAKWDAADVGGWIGPNFHLWFLYYLLMCCVPLLVLSALSARIPVRSVRAFDALTQRVLHSRWKIPCAAALTVPLLWDMTTWWIDTPKGWAPEVAVLAYYLGFFLVGATLYRQRDALAGVGRRWALRLAVANLVVLPAMLKLTVSGNWVEDAVRGAPPAWLAVWKAAAIFLGGLYTWLMIGGLIGLFQKHFSSAGPRWKYLSGASYWCYLAGFPVQAAFQVLFAPTTIPMITEFLLVNVLTFAVLLTSYELCVRHTWIGLVLNGKRPERNAEVRGEPVVIATRVRVPEVPMCRETISRPTPQRMDRRYVLSVTADGV
ncbi:acyltransferase family protein [Gemmata sp. G18]|uniref:Acyltransferase family protein n=1 Tax=Gemmata palustris TaxID=2822762 RepID=A0ABS5BZ13_9BACT|nr:acyltransferase family protein [Gemmata palustris]MBP3958961.1 acyltransferase family protein [Gemmata palustris]